MSVRTAPETVDALAATIRDRYARGDALAFAGGETALGFGYPAERVDAVVSTAGLNRVVAYAPDDLVVTVEAGVTLDALQRTVAERGQRLALDAPDAMRATVGGLIATNGFGPLRARYGTLRDLLLGATLVRADGVIARGGGSVVKNVAGFDVPKLLIGSLGSLGCIATATLRLHPLPEAERTVSTRFASAADVWAFVAALIEAQLEPAAVVAVDAGDGAFDVAVRFEGFGAGVEDQTSACASHAQSLGGAAADDSDIAAHHDAARGPRAVRAKIAYPAARLAAVDAAAFGPLRRALGDAAIAVYPTAGIAFAGGAADDAESASVALASARAGVEGMGGSLVLLDAPDAVRERVDVYGTLPAAFALMRRIKERFDPERRCNPGRFVGRL